MRISADFLFILLDLHSRIRLYSNRICRGTKIVLDNSTSSYVVFIDRFILSLYTVDMEPITLRLPDDLLTILETEATNHGFSSRSEYIRFLLTHRDDPAPAAIANATPDDQDITIADMTDRGGVD